MSWALRPSASIFSKPMLAKMAWQGMLRGETSAQILGVGRPQISLMQSRASATRKAPRREPSGILQPRHGSATAKQAM